MTNDRDPRTAQYKLLWDILVFFGPGTVRSNFPKFLVWRGVWIPDQWFNFDFLVGQGSSLPRQAN